MKSIDRLVAEHELIERGLDVLEKAVSRLHSDRSIPDGFSAWASRFFAEFADKYHHAKGDDLFFSPAHRSRNTRERWTNWRDASRTWYCP